MTTLPSEQRIYLLQPLSRRNSGMHFAHRTSPDFYRGSVITVYRRLRNSGCDIAEARYLIWQVLTAGELGEVASVAQCEEARQAKTTR